MDTDEGEWVDPPMADPQIRKDYEAALGEFLVVFNAIENAVGEVILLALGQAGREDLKAIAWELFAPKVKYLDLLLLQFPRGTWAGLITDLKGLGSQRNSLAHGHFDQNPFDGRYEVISDRGKARPLPISEIRSMTRKAHEVLHTLGYLRANFIFDKI